MLPRAGDPGTLTRSLPPRASVRVCTRHADQRRTTMHARGTALTAHTSLVWLCGSMRILAWVSGSPSASNAASTPSSPTRAGHQRGGVQLAVGEHVQGVAEFQWRVTEYEAQVDLLADRQRGPQLVAAHAHADHDDPRVQRRRGDDRRRSSPARRRIRRSPAASGLPRPARPRRGRGAPSRAACAASPSSPRRVRTARARW